MKYIINHKLLVVMAAVIAAMPMVPAQAELQGWWTFDDASLPAKDFSGHGNDGTLFSNAVRTTDAARGAGALSLDGQGDYMQLFSLSNKKFRGDFTRGQATLALWIKLAQVSPPASMTGFGNIGCWSKPTLYAVNGTTVTLSLFLSHSNGPQVTLPADVAMDQWHHFAVTVNANDVAAGYKVYVNGRNIGSFAMNGAYGNFLGPIWPRLGAAYAVDSNSWYYLNGKVDDVRIYNEALSEAAVLSLFCSQWNSADITKDCVVNIKDLEVIAEMWLQRPLPSDPFVDFDSSGQVNFKDFAIFSGSWLEKNP